MKNVLRTRIIKPGIVTNEKLAELGPHATLLFERLWMLADREGRLEYRPARIHAEAFPYWPDVPVEKIIEDLCKSGFLVKYRATNYSRSWFIFIKHFSKHQSLHPHEAKSALPSPPQVAEVNGLGDDDVITCPDKSRKRRDMSRQNGATSTSIKEVLPKTEVFGVGRESERNHEQPPEPPPPSSPTRRPKRKEPGKAQAATASAGERAPNVQPQEPVNFWPHSTEGVEWLRSLLTEVGKEARLPPPDDDILRRMLDAGRGASAEAIYHHLRRRWQQGRFRSMQSWGLLPVIVSSAFKAA